MQALPFLPLVFLQCCTQLCFIVSNAALWLAQCSAWTASGGVFTGAATGAVTAGLTGPAITGAATGVADAFSSVVAQPLKANMTGKVVNKSTFDNFMICLQNIFCT